ncbi:inactive serine/threonine-protein kinase TEX14-like isoform X2 [Dipodomys merriami]|uniref:inactive serine/threonine-protein kinase TEX14-like isoform X2 n=1 Tax=Dipodomys merriami TaxID=94247 RepID=UPI003855EE48
MRDPDAQVSRLHRLAVARYTSWGLARLLRRVVQVDGENSQGQTALFLSALLGRCSAVRLLLDFGANPNHRCVDGSTPMHAGAFSGRSAVMLCLLQAGGDLRLHDRQGRTPQDWAEQGGAKHSWKVLELLDLCRDHMAALVQGRALASNAILGQLQACSGRGLCGALCSLPGLQADRTLRPGHIGRSSQASVLGFGQLSSLRPLALAMGIPLVDAQELLPAQGEPDCTYENSSCTLMTNLLWRGHPMTVRQLKPPETQPDVLLADLQCCSLLLLLALSLSADLSGLCLLFEPVCLGSLYVVLHQPRSSEQRWQPGSDLQPGPLLLQVLEALLFLQARRWAHGGLSSHAVQLVRPGLAKVGNLEHGRPLHPSWLHLRSQHGSLPGGPGPGPPPPPELYPWLPLELIHSDVPAATSDLYSFCMLTQEVFTGQLPWAGRAGLEVKAKLEAGESPGLDPLVPAPYQAMVEAGLGLRPADRWGSLQSTRYLLRKAIAQDVAPEVSSPRKWTVSPGSPCCPPENLYFETVPKARLVPQGLVPPQALDTPEFSDHSGGLAVTDWDSGSSLTLSSGCSLNASIHTDSSQGPTARVSPRCCQGPSPTVWAPRCLLSWVTSDPRGPLTSDPLRDSPPSLTCVLSHPCPLQGPALPCCSQAAAVNWWGCPALWNSLAESSQSGCEFCRGCCCTLSADTQVPQPHEPTLPADPQEGCLHPVGQAPSTEPMGGGSSSSLQNSPWPLHSRTDLLDESLTELPCGCLLGDQPSLGATTPGSDS